MINSYSNALGYGTRDRGHDFSLKKAHFYCILIPLFPYPLSQRELISIYYITPAYSSEDLR